MLQTIDPLSSDRKSVETSVVAHVDTVELWTWQLADQLPRGRAWRFERAKSGYGYRIIANLPTLTTIKRLATLQEMLRAGSKRHDLILSRIDVGVEFLSDSQQQATEEHHLARRSLHLKWERIDKARQYEDTTYLDEARAARNLAIYSDKPSRMRANLYCCRIELRLRKGSFRSNIGDDVRSILAINPKALFRHHLREVHSPGLLDGIPEALKWPSHSLS